MKKLTFTLNVTWIVAILLSTLSVKGMEPDSPSNDQLKASQAKKYNDNDCQMTSLLDETLTDIFSHCLVQDENQVTSLKKSIKNFMELSIVCKNFNNSLTPEMIGTFCKNYAQADKNSCLDSFNPCSHFHLFPNLILVCAGADPLIEIKNATYNNDIEALTILLKYKANINERNRSLSSAFFGLSRILDEGSRYRDPYSPFFSVNTVKTAQVLIDHNVDWPESDASNHNILWHTITEAECPVELTELYLKHNINPRELDISGNCLLHNAGTHINVEKIKLLLDVIPDMINTVNNIGHTPLDTFNSYNFWHNNKDELVTKLLRDNGGLTTKEIKQKATNRRQKRHDEENRYDCIIS